VNLSDIVFAVLSLDPPIDLRLRVERLSIDADGLLDRWTW